MISQENIISFVINLNNYKINYYNQYPLLRSVNIDAKRFNAVSGKRFEACEREKEQQCEDTGIVITYAFG